MKHFYLPDVQAKYIPGYNFNYLSNIGQYLVEKQPDVIVCGGDFADMPSLSSYDAPGSVALENKRYIKDIDAAHEAMEAFLGPIKDYNLRQKANGKKQYKPRKVLTLGNHEHRINRAINKDAKLEGVLSVDDLEYEKYGWEVYPFLERVIIDGVAYAHYFVTGVAGRPAGTAAAQLRKTNMSSVAGHQQGKQIAYATRADGKTITAIITGSCYEHHEDYMGPQGNQDHWRGCLMLHDVQDGAFDEMWLSLNYLNNRKK
jgi:hypothetical protein